MSSSDEEIVLSSGSSASGEVEQSQLEYDLEASGVPFRVATDDLGVTTVTLPIDRLPISDRTYMAWRIDPELPVCIELKLTYEYLRSALPPEVTVHQFGTSLYQMECLARRYVSLWWHRETSRPEDWEELFKGDVPEGSNTGSNNLFSGLRAFLLGRVPTMANYCMQCDQVPTFGAREGVKQFVCSRPLCYFQFTQLGLGASSGAVYGGDLFTYVLALMTKEAMLSKRAEHILTPAPTLFDEAGAEVPMEAVREAVKEGMPVEAGAEWGAQLALWVQSSLVSRLIWWSMDSNRSYVTALTEGIVGVSTDKQFLILMDGQEKEERFQALKAEHGSVYAFHGSPFENWHSILRNGLRNASGSKLQLHGTAHGAGIYMSPSLRFVQNYSRRGTSGLSCVALCEVIDHEIAKKTKDIWTIQDPDAICTRFLLIYEPGAKVADFNASTPESIEHIRAIQEVNGVYN